MPETFVILKAGFSTADADRPDIAFTRDDLLVKFKDWREQLVTLRFPDTRAFRWQDDAPLPAGARDDTPYEVIDSAWIAEMRSCNALPPEPHHYMLCFNARGVPDVISGPLAMEM
jgi:hypothetical protein